jgi:crotonobetainyl-CoA:carnitine CoA-transferase CaiB-like acyl-CoA transferase
VQPLGGIVVAAVEHPVGREALARLVRRADVVVQNLAPGAAAGLGLDRAELRAARPELITVTSLVLARAAPMPRGEHMTC